MQIEGSVALVTGANRGTGKAFAEGLLERGAAKVYAAMRDATSVGDVDSRLVPVQLDVTDAERVAAVARELGDVQLVVNNAGIARSGTPLSVKLDAARAELEVMALCTAWLALGRRRRNLGALLDPRCRRGRGGARRECAHGPRRRARGLR